ncbi:unnamed protein product [Effrenium voratum]|nr:unnamed protein product [Effrenium voratum]
MFSGFGPSSASDRSPSQNFAMCQEVNASRARDRSPSPEPEDQRLRRIFGADVPPAPTMRHEFVSHEFVSRGGFDCPELLRLAALIMQSRADARSEACVAKFRGVFLPRDQDGN